MNSSTIDQPVAPLDTFGAADLDIVGGKAANLGELLRAGLPVPPGFAVTTDAYSTATDRAGLSGLLTDPATFPAVARSAIEAADVPVNIRDAITAAYLALGQRVPVAVRSSATAEDLPGAAFAGQQDTYLNVVGPDAVMDAVRGCWASLWTDRAVVYRRDRWIDPAEVRIAVVVQTMVESEIAGVMFTADPVSGARDRVIIDAGAGLGEAVVSGLVTPDHYVLDHRGKVIDWSPGGGEVVIHSTTGEGVQRETRDEARTASPLLSRHQLSALAGYAHTIADHFGRPQDIEWAIAGEQVWIVQARPMTALPPETAALNRRQRLLASILTEYLPVRPYPMDVTTVVAHGPARMMAEIGRYYGIVGMFENFLREEDGVAVQIVPSAPHPTPRTLTSIGKIAHRVRRFHPADWAQDSRQQTFLAEVDALESIDITALSWRELITVPDRALAVQNHCRDLRIDFLPGAASALIRLVIPMSLLGRRSMITDLLGGVRTRTEDAGDALAALADDVRADPDLRSLLGTGDGGHALAVLTCDSRFERFRAKLYEFMREFGRRETTSPLLVSPPTLAESPEIVLGMAFSLAAQPPREGEAVSRSAIALRQLLHHPWLRGSIRRQDGMRRRVQAAREAVAFREDTHFFMTAALPTLRRALLEIGHRLTKAGFLDDSSDVFQLRWEEVAGLTEPSAIASDYAERLRERIRQRAKKRAELAGVPMIDPQRVFPSADAGDALVRGIPSGSGTATGVARVIRGPDEFDRLVGGEVLVCPYTNPAWTPLFRRAAAVVVDTGSIVSHAAIVAREYGIPAIMGTGTGTSVICDGESITVDGTRGRVTRAGER